MNNIQYYRSAWGDIKNSPGWFGKLCLLALLNFIPVFGQIVTFGYLYGWAREIAWGTHEPMPAHIFGNEDGKLYRRGWFILVLVFVATLVPTIVMSIGSGLQGAGAWGVASDSHAVASSLLTGVGLVVYLIGLLGALLLGVLAWIGSMRISIYDRLSAGFQLGKMWKMLRYDTNGILRVFGMSLLVGFIISIILTIVFSILMFLAILAGVAGLAASGYSVTMLQHMSDAQAMAAFASLMGSAGLVGFLGVLIIVFLAYLAEVYILALVARAMGYWTMQFDVPRWRGQDDPMPFETAPSAVGAPPANPVPPTPVYGQYNPYVQPAQPIQPTQPAAPVVSFQPTEPVAYVQPEQPTQPVASFQPTEPVMPEQPTEPVEPAQPTEPVQPMQQEEPAEPEGPAQS